MSPDRGSDALGGRIVRVAKAARDARQRGAHDGTPGVLLILNYDVRDAEALTRYRGAASPVIVGTTGQVLVSTSATTQLPEAPAVGARTVVIWYPSREEADRCYSSAEYQNLLPDRLAATTPAVAILVDVDEKFSPIKCRSRTLNHSCAGWISKLGRLGSLEARRWVGQTVRRTIDTLSVHGSDLLIARLQAVAPAHTPSLACLPASQCSSGPTTGNAS